MRPPTS